MSSKRDVGQDRNATLDAFAGKASNDGTRNWLGHRLDAGTGKIDELLLCGATLEQMGEARGAADQHIKHLKQEHGLPIVESNGVWSFDRRSLGDVDSETTAIN